jgi:hypothetical protein
MYELLKQVIGQNALRVRLNGRKWSKRPKLSNEVVAPDD